MTNVTWKNLNVCPNCGKKLTCCDLTGQYCCYDCYKNDPEYKEIWDGKKQLKQSD
jgi:hypothetical protein